MSIMDLTTYCHVFVCWNIKNSAVAPSPPVKLLEFEHQSGHEYVMSFCVNIVAVKLFLAPLVVVDLM